MALFKKKEKNEEEVPKFPELPKLPEFPDVKENHDGPVPQLPSFPNSSLGDKFSQNTIKEAVTGKKEDEGDKADEFADEEMQMMPKPLVTKPGNMLQKNEKPETNKKEPIFIRIDKFEEGSQIFEEVKKQIISIEKMSADVAKTKEREDKELASWEAELKEIKEKIEKIDQNIFSKHG